MNMLKDESSEDITLVDYWEIIVKRKSVLLMTVTIFIVLAIAYMFFSDEKYSYTASIEIGTHLVKDNIRPIESPDTVLAKIKESYIPFAVNKFYRQNPEYERKIELDVKVPKSSEIVVLQSKGLIDDQEVYTQIMNDVINSTVSDHERIEKIITKTLAVEKNLIKSSYDELNDQLKFVLIKLDRLKDERRVVQEELMMAKELLDNIAKNRMNAVSNAKNEATALTIMMLDSEINDTHGRIIELEYILHVTLTDKKDELEKELLDIKRFKNEKLDEISKIELEIDNLRKTQTLLKPIKSHEPISLNKRLISFVLIFAGLVLGVFFALFFELLSALKQEKINYSKMS